MEKKEPNGYFCVYDKKTIVAIHFLQKKPTLLLRTKKTVALPFILRTTHARMTEVQNITSPKKNVTIFCS